jgi:hypothetical protein
MDQFTSASFKKSPLIPAPVIDNHNGFSYHILGLNFA